MKTLKLAKKITKTLKLDKKIMKTLKVDKKFSKNPKFCTKCSELLIMTLRPFLSKSEVNECQWWPV